MIDEAQLYDLRAAIAAHFDIEPDNVDMKIENSKLMGTVKLRQFQVAESGSIADLYKSLWEIVRARLGEDASNVGLLLFRTDVSGNN